jgi:Glycoside hydrolase family 44
MPYSRLMSNGASFGCALLVLASVGFGCRKLTAQPAKPATVTRPTSFVIAESIYDGSIKPGWQDWGWGPHDLSAGAARVNFSNYGGWILHHDPISTRFQALLFRVKAPAAAGRFLEVRVAAGDKDESFPAVEIGPEHARALPDGWVEMYVPWEQLNPAAAAFDRITIRAKAPVDAAWISFDKIGLTEFDAKAARAAALAAPVRRVRLAASCSAQGHPISPYIYGIVANVEDTGATIRRWGGNPTSRYNWELGDATNVGKDWYFENTKTGDYQSYLKACREQKVPCALTVPINGWVAKDRGSFGFPISVYGAQRSHDPYKNDAGDGMRPDGSEIVPKAATQTSTPAPPEFIQRWVQTIAKKAEQDQARTIQQYILDNEPSLWSVNHRDVHPDPLTYEELLDRTVRYGTAIRQADPLALIAGPAEWGWTAYFYSAKDNKAGVILRPDRRAHGDVPMIPWYLGKLREHEKSTGIKVLDVLDLHFYPQGQNVFGAASDPATAALRIRSTRALWDSTYKDESWINDTVRLIPRIKEWVAQNYPGLKISLGEYNFGGEGHISGGLAEAEALGRFGQQGLDYAFYWVAPPKSSPSYWAFRAFRNFDGKGAHFLDRSMDTQMASDVSLFASRDESGKHLVLIALNLDPTTSAKAKISLPGCAPVASIRKYFYGPQSTSLLDEGTVAGLEQTLLPYSINVFDVTLK